MSSIKIENLKTWKNSAPSNIALIKYMGKLDGQQNQATNKSLSYSLEHLRTFVEITYDQNITDDQWQALHGQGLYPIELSQKGQQRFLEHFKLLKTHWGIEHNFVIKSANNFPSDCGLASSASSFAALTRTAADCFNELNHQVNQQLSATVTLSLSEQQSAAKTLPRKIIQSELELARLSRLGSGSSCRSLFGPWVSWKQDDIQKVEIKNYEKLLHQVVIVEGEKKEVSSSEAHKRVVTSLLFTGRIERAELRLAQLIQAFAQNDWKKAYELCWAEFWDMHALFESSQPHFSYMTTGSIQVLRLVEKIWSTHGDGPIVTMDAGANIHLLYRNDQIDLARKISQNIAEESGIGFKIITNLQKII